MEQFSRHSEPIIIKNYLPHNFLAEKMILSSLLISSEAMDLTFRTISVETFYFKNHQEIFKAILFMYQNKIPIDILTLTTFLQDNGLLKKDWWDKSLNRTDKSNSKFSLFGRIYPVSKR
jgi:replicative DNA helicase